MRSLPLVFAVAAIAILSGAILSAQDADAAQGNDQPRLYTIYGYVGSLASEVNSPLEGVKVTPLDAEGNVIGMQTFTSDSEGRFEITMDLNSLARIAFLKFELGSYTVRSVPDNLPLVDGVTNMVEFNFDVRAAVNANPDAGEYAITETISKGSFIAMMLTTGQISGYVYGADGDRSFSLENASVTITSSSYRATVDTNADGLFIFDDCPYGDYVLTVSCSGFNDSEPIEVSMGDQVDQIVLSSRSSDLIFGLSTPYAMELIGLIVAALIILCVALVYHVNKKRGSTIDFVNDVEDMEEEQDEVRRP